MMAALMRKAGYARSRRKRALRWLDRDPDFCNGACLFPTIAMLRFPDRTDDIRFTIGAAQGSEGVQGHPNAPKNLRSKSN